MANKKLSYDQIADKNLMQPLIKEFEDLNNVLNTTTDILKEVVKNAAKIEKQDPAKPYENLKQAEEKIRDVEKATKDLDKLEKERIKLEQRQIELLDDRAKANAELREQVRLQAKELRDNAKEALATDNAYKTLTKQTNEAQAEFKRLAAEFGTTSDQAQAALKRFTQLDKQLREINKAAKDGRRDVGRYSDAIEETEKQVKSLSEQLKDAQDDVKSLGNTFKTLGVVTVILQVFDQMQQAFSANSEGAAELEKAVSKVTITISVVVGRLIKLIPTIQNGFEKLTTEVQLGFEKLTNILGGNEEKISELQKRLDELNSKELPTLEDAFEGVTEEVENLIKTNDNLIDNTLQYRKEIVDLEKDLAGLTKTQTLQQVAADDTTRSLQEQAKAQEELNDTNDIILAKEVEIAQKRLELAQENAKVNKFSIEAQEQLAESIASLAEKEAEQIATREEGLRTLREIERDALERRLDFLIDDFDNQKTVNERIAQSEVETFERRRAILEDTETLANASFKRQEAELNASLERQGKAILDFEELQKMTSSEAIARKIEESGLDDVLAGRALEIIRERRTANQDLVEAFRDLNEAERESNEVESDLILTREALNEAEKKGADLSIILSSLEDKRLQNEINNLNTRLAMAEKGSEERIQIEADLNEKLLTQQQKRIEKEQEEEAKNAEKKKEFYEDSFAVIEQVATKRFDAIQSGIDDELETERERESELQELAAQGNENAEKNLAENQKRQAELEREREAAIQRQRRVELGLAAIQSYQNAVQNDEPNPLAKTISDISVLQAFIDNIPAFYEGTENTGTVSNPLDQNGGRLAILHDNERVMTANQNKIIGPMSNMEVAMRVKQSKEQDNKPLIDLSPLQNSIKSMENTIKNQPILSGSEYDGKLQELIITHERKQKLESKHYSRKGGLYGRN